MHSLILSVQIVLACVAFGFVSASGAPKPFGFGSQTTGGGSAVPQTPKSLAQLESWLADSVPRVIVIDRTFDFSNAQGNATDEGWYVFINICEVWGVFSFFSSQDVDCVSCFITTSALLGHPVLAVCKSNTPVMLVRLILISIAGH